MLKAMWDSSTAMLHHRAQFPVPAEVTTCGTAEATTQVAAPVGG